MHWTGAFSPVTVRMVWEAGWTRSCSRTRAGSMFGRMIEMLLPVSIVNSHDCPSTLPATKRLSGPWTSRDSGWQLPGEGEEEIVVVA